MAGPRLSGWEAFESADKQYETSIEHFGSAKSGDYGMPLAEFGIASSFVSGALQVGLQELYERIQRLHQKIDRLEEKVGSLPKKK
ncbi:MAG TPA: hypothetical protein VMM15_25735 [Bradyrhizobium sp.]|nr:hypothetical protein [Bradyrhizobium sp.]